MIMIQALESTIESFIDPHIFLIFQCAEDNGFCAQICINKPGSFECGCQVISRFLMRGGWSVTPVTCHFRNSVSIFFRLASDWIQTTVLVQT